MEAKQQMRIQIGHSSYSGVNASAWPTSKAKAIDILRDRGVKRDDARAALKRVLSGSGRRITTYGGMFGNDVIEVAAYHSSVLA